jgi:SAM-dependent methyltransferase
VKADYDLIVDEWLNARQQLPQLDRELFDFFTERLPTHAGILDLGCGSGVPVTSILVERGFVVTGVDRSTSLLAHAKELLPMCAFHKAEIEEYAITANYGGIVLWDVLFHIPRQQHYGILKKIYQALNPFGLLILSSGGSEHEIPPFTDFMFGVAFFYDAYPILEFYELCINIGFTVEKGVVVNKADGLRDKGRIGMVLSKA